MLPSKACLVISQRWPLRAGVANLVPAIATITDLEELVVAYNDLVPEDVAKLASAIANLKHLQVLNLEHNNLAPDGTLTLITARADALP